MATVSDSGPAPGNTGRRSSPASGRSTSGSGPPRLGEPPDVLRAPPVVGPVPVAVGDDDPTGRRRSPPPARSVGQGRAVAEQLAAVEQSSRGGVDQAVAAAGHDDHVVLGPDDGDGVVHRNELDGRHRLPDPRIGDRLLVDDGDLGLVDGRLAVGDRRAQPDLLARRRPPSAARRNRSSVSSGSRRAEAVERRIAGQPDGVGAEEPGHGGDRGGLGHAALEAVVQGVEQVHGAGAAEGQEVPGDQRPVGQSREGRIDGVPPAKGAELGPGELRARGSRWARRRAAAAASVHAVGGVLVALEGRVDQAGVG